MVRKAWHWQKLVLIELSYQGRQLMGLGEAQQDENQHNRSGRQQETRRGLLSATPEV